MNIAVVLAGGIGSRIGNHLNVPKQYSEVNSKPVFIYCSEIFNNHESIDKIVFAVAENWLEHVKQAVKKYNLQKVSNYAIAGTSRQHSIYNALKEINKFAHPEDVVLIHDAVRPLLSEDLISRCINIENGYDGIMPVIPVKDTIYTSSDGIFVNGTLNRDELYLGQTPESFRFKKYFSILEHASDQELTATKGSSEIAFKHLLRIKFVPGSEDNVKLTTKEDWDMFVMHLNKNPR